MFKSILRYFFFIPKFFPYFRFENQMRPYFGIPKRNYGGSNLRTIKMIKYFGNYYFSPNILYAQSWWTEKEINDCIRYSKKNNIPIVFNQDGWFYPAWYKSDWKKRNKIIIKAQKLSKKVIYQSHFCKKTSLTLNNYRSRKSKILYNFPLINKKKRKINKKIFNILLTGVFGKESEHILIPALKAIEFIEERKLSNFNYKLQIYGVIKDDMKNSNWFYKYNNIYKKLNNKGLVFFKGKYNHKNLDKILLNTNLAIHLKYKDPCPNAVLEKLNYGIPHIFSISGGTTELVGNAGYGLKVKDQWNKMLEVNYKILAKKIILAKKFEKNLTKNSVNQSKKFSYSKYILEHKKIFNNLNT